MMNVEHSDTNGKIRRSSRDRKVRKLEPWNSTPGSDEEEQMGEAFFDRDNDYIDDGGDYSEGSDFEYGARKKKKAIKTPVKSKPKSKRSKKVQPKPPQRRGARRSSRTTSNPDYCEESDDDSDDVYELCDGQPKLATHKKKTPARKIQLREDPIPKQKQTKKRSARKVASSKSTTSCVATVSPDLVKTDLTPSSRSSSRKRSQVSYVEDSSDDELDSYDICDGQPVKRRSSEPLVDKVGSTLPKHKKIKIEKTAQSSNVVKEEDSEDKVVLVEGQPVLKKKALSMLEDENQFYMKVSETCLSEEELLKPLCIWKVRGKLLERFEQVESSKTFESTTNCVEYDEGELDKLYFPVKALVFGKKEERLLAEIVDDPENEDVKTMIERHVRGGRRSRKKNEQRDVQANSPPTSASKRATPKQAKKPPTTTKTKASKKTVLQDSSIPPRKRGKPRKGFSESEEVDEFKEISHAFPLYLTVLLRGSIHTNYVQNMPEENAKHVDVIDDVITSLAGKLLDGVALKEEFLESLRTLPIFFEEDKAIDRFCDGSTNPDVTANKLVTLTGQRYDRTTLSDTEGVDAITRQFALCENLFQLSRSFHRLHNFKKNLFNDCKKKIEAAAILVTGPKAAVENQISEEDDQTVSQSVKKVLHDIINRVTGADSDTGDDEKQVLNEKEILRDVINRVTGTEPKLDQEKQVAVVDSVAETVRETVNDVISDAEKYLTAAGPLEEVRKTLDEVLSSVEAKCDSHKIDMCLADEDWVAKMLADLKGAILEAKEVIASR